MNNQESVQELVQKYLEALYKGDFGQLEELAERAGYDRVLTVEKLFGKEWMEQIQDGLKTWGYIDITPYWSGLLREKSYGDSSKLYVAGGQRNGKSKLMKGRFQGEDRLRHKLGHKLIQDVFYDPDLTAPIHWGQSEKFDLFNLTTALLVKLPVTYTKRGFQKLFNPDYTKYNETAVRELVTEAYQK